jgi:hypothetical protein
MTVDAGMERFGFMSDSRRLGRAARLKHVPAGGRQGCPSPETFADAE